MIYPNLQCAKIIGIDTETHDEGLANNKGPGFARDDSYLAGISVAVETGESWYFPVAHAIGKNCDRGAMIRWANAQLGTDIQKVFANATYDIGWLQTEDITIGGRLHDVQIAEPLLDEHAFSYALNSLGQKYLGVGKSEDELYDHLAKRFGGKADRKQAGNIWREDGNHPLIQKYAKQDALLPINILYKQLKLINEQDLNTVYDLECELVPLLVAMNGRGIRIDIDECRGSKLKLEITVDDNMEEINNLAGYQCSVTDPKSFAGLFDKLGIEYPLTAKTKKPSITKAFLENLDHPIGQLIRDTRQAKHFASTFIQSYLIDKHIQGRVHCQFNALKGDLGGTKMGRFSSSNPNLQNIPARGEQSKLIRGLFLPDENELINAVDYSSIEVRQLVHYGVGKQGDKFRQLFNDDATIDFHDLCKKLLKDNLNIDLERKKIKEFSFSKIYGQGLRATAKKLNTSMAEARKLVHAYDQMIPIAKDLAIKVSSVANRRGYIKTILGRRCRFNQWEPARWNWPDNQRPPIGKMEEMKERYGCIKRANTYKALHGLLSGSAADLIKQAMVNIYKREDIIDVLGVPLLTVHDELVFSVPDTADGRHAAKQVALEMCIALPQIKIPLIVDSEWGTNWGNVQ